MRPDVMAKRYSHGIQELAEVESKNPEELVVLTPFLDTYLGSVEYGSAR